MAIKTSKDFSAGTRLRLPLYKYDPTSKAFKSVKGVAFLVTVANADEQRRLWRAIDRVIHDGEWRHERAARADAVPGDPLADVPQTP